MYGITHNESLLDNVAKAVQDFWPGVTSEELGFGAEDEKVQLSMLMGIPVFTLLANYNNDERAALAIHSDDRLFTQKLNKDTLSEEWAAFVDGQMSEYE